MTEHAVTTRDVVRGILKLYPDLTYGGFAVGGGPKRSPQERASERRRARREMLTPQALEQFCRACDWLDDQPRTGRINSRAGNSYCLKEEVEQDGAYVSSGMFITAAIACGYQVERAGFNSRHAWLNISQLRPSNPNLHLFATHPTAVHLLKQLTPPLPPPASGRLRG
jgi:hypothetical protein